MHIWFAPASHSNANASVRGATITSDGSVRVQDWNGEWTIAENAPKDLTMLAIPGGHLWGLRGDGMLFRWSVQSDRRRWVRDTSIDRVNWICVSPENELCVVNEMQELYEVDLSGTKIKQLDPFMNLISLSELKLAGTRGSPKSTLMANWSTTRNDRETWRCTRGK